MGEDKTGYRTAWSGGAGGRSAVLCDACPVRRFLPFGDRDRISLSRLRHDEGCAVPAEGTVSEILGAEPGSRALGPVGFVVCL